MLKVRFLTTFPPAFIAALIAINAHREPVPPASGEAIEAAVAFAEQQLAWAETQAVERGERR